MRLRDIFKRKERLKLQFPDKTVYEHDRLADMRSDLNVSLTRTFEILGDIADEQRIPAEQRYAFIGSVLINVHTVTGELALNDKFFKNPEYDEFKKSEYHKEFYKFFGTKEKEKKPDYIG